MGGKMIKIDKKCKINKKELNIGKKIELEHTTSNKVAEKIAKQHLCEFPKYYTEGLLPMEKKLKNKIKKYKLRSVN